MAWDDARARAALRAAFDAAVAAADPRRVLASHLPPKPRGRCIVVGARKIRRPDGRSAGRRLAGRAAGRRRRHPLRPRHADPAHRGDGSLPPRPRRNQRGRRPPHPRRRPRPRTGRSGSGADLRRRLGAAAAAGARPDARRQAGGQPGAARLGRDDHRDELRAQASVGDQGRAAGRRRGAGAGGDARHQRRARRRSGGDRQRPDRARPDDLRRGARHPRPPRHRPGRRTSPPICKPPPTRRPSPANCRTPKSA